MRIERCGSRHPLSEKFYKTAPKRAHASGSQVDNERLSAKWRKQATAYLPSNGTAKGGHFIATIIRHRRLSKRIGTFSSRRSRSFWRRAKGVSWPGSGRLMAAARQIIGEIPGRRSAAAQLLFGFSATMSESGIMLYISPTRMRPSQAKPSREGGDDVSTALTRSRRLNAPRSMGP